MAQTFEHHPSDPGRTSLPLMSAQQRLNALLSGHAHPFDHA